jgi:hypothetical protein
MTIILATSPLQKIIRTTEAYWEYVITVKHTNMASREKEVRDTLNNPDFIRRSKIDPQIFLYYQAVGEYFWCVVVRHENGTGFLVRSYKTDKIKEGELIWTK